MSLLTGDIKAVILTLSKPIGEKWSHLICITLITGEGKHLFVFFLIILPSPPLPCELFVSLLSFWGIYPFLIGKDFCKHKVIEETTEEKTDNIKIKQWKKKQQNMPFTL